MKALRDGHHGYTPATGILPLREAVAADLHKRFKVSVSPDEVMILPGGKPTMFMSILMFGEPGADILYPDPGFPDLPLDDRIYRRAADPGADPRGERISPSRPRRRSTLITPQTRLLIVNSPANPTGGVTPEARGRQAGRRAGEISRRRGDVGRDLRPHGLRRRGPCLPALLSVDPRPADPAQRLVEDLCDDRLAARLRDLARQALRLCAQARGQPAFLRQCLGAICRPRRAQGSAGRGAQDGRRVRPAAQGRGRGPQPAAGRDLRHAQGRVLRLSQRQAHRLEGEGARRRRSWRTPASPSSAARISAFSARATCGSPTPTRPRTSSRRSTAWASFWRRGRRLRPVRIPRLAAFFASAPREKCPKDDRSCSTSRPCAGFPKNSG